MQPYQKATEAIRSTEEYPVKLAKSLGMNALTVGAAGAAGRAGSQAIGSLLPRVSALINQHVPEALSMKGLSKIDPRFSKFIQGALDEGYSYEDVRGFLGEKISKSEPQENAKDNKNIIQMYSPELHEFIMGEIQQGRSPLEAGALASLDRKGKDFKKIIKQIEKDHKAPFSAILETAYGGQGAAKQAPDPGQQPAGQSGQGQAALMAILQKIQQARGAQ